MKLTSLGSLTIWVLIIAGHFGRFSAGVDRDQANPTIQSGDFAKALRLGGAVP